MTKDEVRVLILNNRDDVGWLNSKKAEKKMLELRITSAKDIEPRITSIYEEHASSGNVSDTTANVAIEKIDKESEDGKRLKQVEIEIAELEYRIAEYDRKTSCFTRDEKFLLEISIINDDFSYTYIGNKVYLDKFHETRSKDYVFRCVKKAYEKLGATN